MIVRTVALSKRFGDLEVLRNVSLAVEEGEHIGLLGPSGCGKTTLLRILLGLEPASGGSVDSLLCRTGYLPQEALLLPWKTVIENVELPLQIRGIERDARRTATAERLERFGLRGFEAAYPRELSGGMRQRAALLRAVMMGAESLVLDEPFGALDALTRYRLQLWLADLAADLAGTLILVTHDLEEAVALAERIIVLSKRPASVVGTCDVPLSTEERSNRFAETFLNVKNDVMNLVLRGAEDDLRQPV